MPDFQANIQVEATEGASLRAIDTKINQWKSGIKSAVNFTASGLDDIESRLKALKNTKVKISVDGGGRGGGGGGSRGGSGGSRGGSGGGRKSDPNKLNSVTLSGDIKRYNSLHKSLAKAGERERDLIEGEMDSINKRIQSRLKGANAQTRRIAKAQMAQGTFEYDRATAQIADRQAATNQRKAEQAATRAQRQAERQAATERRQDFRNVISSQKEYDRLAAQHSVTDSNSKAYQVEEEQLKQLYDTRKQAMSQMGKFSAAEQKQYRDAVNSGKALQQQVQYQKQYREALEADRRGTALDDHTKKMMGYDFEAWLNQNGRARKKYGDRIDKVSGLMKGMGTVGESEDTQKLFDELRAEVSAKGAGGMTFGQKLKASIGDLSNYVSPMMIANYAKQIGQAMYQNVEQIDAGMTELRKITNNSEAEYKQFGQNAKRTAVAVGTTQRELINSSADWARLNN